LLSGKLSVDFVKELLLDFSFCWLEIMDWSIGCWLCRGSRKKPIPLDWTILWPCTDCNKFQTQLHNYSAE